MGETALSRRKRISELCNFERRVLVQPARSGGKVGERLDAVYPPRIERSIEV